MADAMQAAGLKVRGTLGLLLDAKSRGRGAVDDGRATDGGRAPAPGPAAYWQTLRSSATCAIEPRTTSVIPGAIRSLESGL